ncbi:MAG: hypothetical protein K9M94_14935 [Spirochaetia bacterium]|nr:hypothetical protein [Spirochaetia bacterium]
MSKKVVIPAGEIIHKENVPQKLGVHYQREFIPEVAQLIEEARKKGISQLKWEITLPRKPRSKGPRSQNNRIWGNCQDIADQLGEYTAEEIKAAMQRMAVDDGYPTKMSVDGKEIPKPTSTVSSEEAKILLDVIQKFADEQSLYLTEYDGQGPYKTVGGRTREEMREYWK